MKSRQEVARFIERQMHWGWNKPAIPDHYGNGSVSAHHYGLCELRELLDFIYESPPTNDFQCIRKNPADIDEEYRQKGEWK